MRNLITDVPGVLVGNAQDMRAATGATVAIFEQGAVASSSKLERFFPSNSLSKAHGHSR